MHKEKKLCNVMYECFVKYMYLHLFCEAHNIVNKLFCFIRGTFLIKTTLSIVAF